MCCGGKVDVYIEPVVKKLNLIIFGAGHIGKSLAKLANELEFTVTLVDERAEMTEDLQGEHYKLITKNYRRAFPSLPLVKALDTASEPSPPNTASSNEEYCVCSVFS